ncbi:ABC transporter substrate-binding protein [Nakamurella aerolata]|uniref:ABC transporter substrate-binding protein n=1 Tax=Nakamurella aerolata TaxID=1656892 RepID=UPI001BB11075
MRRRQEAPGTKRAGDRGGGPRVSTRATGRRARKRRTALAAAALVAAAGLTACSSGDGGMVINVYGGTTDTDWDKVLNRCNQQADGRYRIVGNLLPSDADGQREQLVRRLAAKDSGMDVLGMDVIWTAEFAEAGWVRELTGAQQQQASDGVLAKPLETATWKGKLYGIPRHTNVQLMWYRKSLVPNPPKTWDEMIKTAQQLKSEGKTYQIGLTGSQYEGYVVAFNTMLTSYGGTLVNEDSTQATVDDKTVQALTLLKNFATSGVASPSLSQSQEPQVFAQLQTGQAAFAINWPYVLASMRDAGKTDPNSKKIADDLGYAVYPQIVPGKQTTVTMGGMNYGISSYSKHPEESFEAAMCLRDETSQLMGALAAGNVPSLQSVYDNPEFQKAYPMYQVILDELEVASIRPKSPVYQNISSIVSSTLSPPQSIQPEATANSLRTDIQETLEGKGILP